MTEGLLVFERGAGTNGCECVHNGISNKDHLFKYCKSSSTHQIRIHGEIML